MDYKKIISSIVLALMLIPIMAVPLFATNYTVQVGDSLFKIGQRFGVDYGKIMAVNNLKSSKILPGSNLYIPDGSKLYTVRPGDTLFLLAKRFNTSVAAIKNINGLWQDKIKINQKLWIPAENNPNQVSRSYSRYNLSNDDLYLMARAVYSEARGESYTGQVAIAAVILNRLDSPDFPNTVSGVIFQPWAFTAVHDGQFWLTPNTTAVRAVRDAVNGWDPTNGALYYWNPQTATNEWIWSRPIIKQIGKHVFAY